MAYATGGRKQQYARASVSYKMQRLVNRDLNRPYSKRMKIYLLVRLRFGDSIDNVRNSFDLKVAPSTFNDWRRKTNIRQWVNGVEARISAQRKVVIDKDYIWEQTWEYLSEQVVHKPGSPNEQRNFADRQPTYLHVDDIPQPQQQQVAPVGAPPNPPPMPPTANAAGHQVTDQPGQDLAMDGPMDPGFAVKNVTTSGLVPGLDDRIFASDGQLPPPQADQYGLEEMDTSDIGLLP